MDNRRFTALMITMLFMILWINVVVPRLFPNLFKPQNQQVQAQNAGEDPADDAAVDEEPAADGAVAGDEPAEVLAPPVHPRETVELGSADPDSDYYMKVVASSQGASLLTAEFNDPNFLTLDRKGPLSILRPVTLPDGKEFRTLTIAVPVIDAQLSDHETKLSELDWEVVPGSQTESSVAFQIEYGGFRLIKTFTLNEGDPKAREHEYQGYFVNVDLQIVNLTDSDQEIEYTWLGPVGLPQENAFNARFLQEVKVGALENHSNRESITAVERNAQAVVDQVEEAREQNDPNAIDTWRDPMVYVGVNVQYFAALMVPKEDVLQDVNGDGEPDPTWQAARPRLLDENKARGMLSEISVAVRSRKISLAAQGNDDSTHANEFQLYLGPKRENILNQFHAGQVISYGWNWVAPISRLMLRVLNFFHHSVGLPYALAIILLTICVKTIMLPFSIKTAEVQRKQKMLTPELNQIKERLKSEPEKFLKAQRELFHKHGHRPFVYGCLPSLLMLPIYMGLFFGLDKAFDLRLSEFLWINNLAAPDALFRMPFALWYFGQDFNLLPVLTVALMIVQQKYFAPPPATEEQAMQMKIMSYSMVLIGLMFWHVAAGLCLYFITQNLWGMGERKLLEYLRPQPAPSADGAAAVPAAVVAKRGADSESTTDKSPTFWQRLQSAADQARNQSSLNNGNSRGETASQSASAQRKAKRRR